MSKIKNGGTGLDQYGKVKALTGSAVKGLRQYGQSEAGGVNSRSDKRRTLKVGERANHTTHDTMTTL